MNEQDALNFANEKLREYGLAEKWTVEIRVGMLAQSGSCMGVTTFKFSGRGGLIILRLRDLSRLLRKAGIRL